MRAQFTVITSTLNCVNDLKETYDALSLQQEADIQWIVADCLSTDGTVEFLKKIKNYKSLSLNYFSENDTGIYDAWNKACKLIKYKWTIFLGAGDIFFDKTTLLNVWKLLPRDTNPLLVYGNVIQKRKNGKNIISKKVNVKSFTNFTPSIPFHQGVFHHIGLLKKNNPFDISYKIVGDSKFMLNYYKSGSDFIYIDQDVTYMKEGGISANPKNTFLVMKELLKLEKDVGYKLPLTLKIKLILRTIYKQFVI